MLQLGFYHQITASRNSWRTGCGSWEREVKDEPRAAARGAGGTAVLSWSWAMLRPAAVGDPEFRNAESRV